MHILEMVSGSGVNGAITHCRDLTRELARRGHRVTLACYGDSWLSKHEFPPGVELLPTKMERWPTTELRRVAKYVRDERVDVVHTHASRAHFFGVLLRLFGAKCVASAHSRHVQPHWMFNNHVVAMTEATRRFHSRWNLVSSKSMDVVHYFVDAARFERLAKPDGVRLRESIGVQASEPLILVLGNVFHRKGQRYLAEAMPRIAQAIPNVKVALIGDVDPVYFNQVKRIADQARLADRFVALGRRDDVPLWLRAADVMALPSLEEQMPMSILEAMASRLPVVATDVGGISECVRHGQDGLLVPAKDAAALAQAIVDTLIDTKRAQERAESAFQRIGEHFTPGSEIAKLERIFQRVAGIAA